MEITKDKVTELFCIIDEFYKVFDAENAGKLFLSEDGLKISSKMKKSIEKLEKQYGKLNKRFFIERDERVRVGNGFYDGCQLTDDIIKSRNIIVAHDGTIS